MNRLVVLGTCLCMPAGCATGPYVAAPAAQTPLMQVPAFENPVLLPVPNHEIVWETVVDVVDDYFRVADEEPVRLIGNVMTEGRLETLPETGATLFEPWRRDSVTGYERLESTLQSMRRYALVRVMPAEQGFRVEVNVFKELEDVVQPDPTTTGEATFRYDTSLTRVVNPLTEQEIHEGWIPKGRDLALEQEMLGQLLARFGRVAPR